MTISDASGGEGVVITRLMSIASTWMQNMSIYQKLIDMFTRCVDPINLKLPSQFGQQGIVDVIHLASLLTRAQDAQTR